MFRAWRLGARSADVRWTTPTLVATIVECWITPSYPPQAQLNCTVVGSLYVRAPNTLMGMRLAWKKKSVRPDQSKSYRKHSPLVERSEPIDVVAWITIAIALAAGPDRSRVSACSTAATRRSRQSSATS
jgi:hypothetical protein